MFLVESCGPRLHTLPEYRLVFQYLGEGPLPVESYKPEQVTPGKPYVHSRKEEAAQVLDHPTGGGLPAYLDTVQIYQENTETREGIPCVHVSAVEEKVAEI